MVGRTSRLPAIGGRLNLLVVPLGVAILGYVSLGAGGVAGGLAILLSLGLILVALGRARQDPEQAALVGRISSRALMLLPGAALVFLAYEAGGFFPGPPSLLAVLLALVLAARLALGLGSLSRAPAAIAAALGAYTAWVLLSGSWSHAAERALTEADLALVYGLAFVLFATAVTGLSDLRWVMRGLALGAFVVCLGAFLSRAVPTLWPIAGGLDTVRVSYPLTYWNGLGLVAALAIIICVGLTSDDQESRGWKALSALPIPLFGATLLLTFSRGAIAAGLVGLIAFALLGRTRSLLSATIAVVPTAAFAVIAAYDATSLARPLDGSLAQTRDGHHVALVVVACGLAAAVSRGLLAGIDVALVRRAERRPLSTAAARTGWAAAIGAVVVASLALNLPDAVSQQYDRFVQGGRNHAQLRDRLTDPFANGRIELWRVAVHEFEDAPLAGTGAGTFELSWAAHRPPPGGQVLDAHSIYAENLGELGIVGLALLACIVLGSLVAIGQRVRGPERTLYVVAVAALLAWALHAGVDWDWELPATTLPVFMLAGAALGRSGSAGGVRRRRPVLALAVLASAVVPALVNVSQSHLDTSLAAVARNDCATATSAARSALEPLGFRRAPHEVLAYCHAARGERGPALAEMRTAIRDDPKSWEPQYGLAVLLGAFGRDPRPAARATVALDRYDPVVIALEEGYRKSPRARWPAAAAAAPLPIAGEYGTSLAGLRTAPGTLSAPPRRSRVPR